MYAQLGNMIFEGVNGFQSLSRIRAVKYTEIQLVDGKPRLQRNGIELTSLALEMKFHVGFGIDPTTEINRLITWQNTGEVLPLIDGQGTEYGNFVIRSVSDSPEVMRVDGKVIWASVSVQLTEFVDPNAAATAKRESIAKGFATDPLKVIPIRVVRVGTTPASITSIQSREAALNGAAAAADIQEAYTTPTRKESLFMAAKVKAEAAASGAREAITRLGEIASLAAKAPALLASLESVRDNSNLMIQRIAEGDLTNALTQATALTAATDTVDGAVRPLDISLILRQPI